MILSNLFAVLVVTLVLPRLSPPNENCPKILGSRIPISFSFCCLHNGLREKEFSIRSKYHKRFVKTLSEIITVFEHVFTERLNQQPREFES